MKPVRYALLGGAALAVAPVPAHAVNIVVNGSFEQDVIAPNSFREYNPATAPGITGWTVASGTVDLTRLPTYVAAEGAQAVDLLGSSNGTLTQTLATVIGQVYSLTFAYSHNNLSDPNFVYSANVSAGTLSQAFSATGNPATFLTFSGEFVATSASTLLSFASLTGTGNGGVFLDDVSVQAVPEPASWAMMILGFGLVGGAMRYGRRETRVAFAA